MSKREVLTPLGQKIKLELINKGMSQRELSKKTGISQTTISNIMHGSTNARGYRKYSNDTALRIMAELGVENTGYF